MDATCRQIRIPAEKDAAFAEKVVRVDGDATSLAIALELVADAALCDSANPMEADTFTYGKEVLNGPQLMGEYSAPPGGIAIRFR